MAFVKKEWKDRITEYPGRRRLVDADTGKESVVDVTRDEGLVSQAGDAFSATTMNDLEQRISSSIEKIESSGSSSDEEIKKLSSTVSSHTESIRKIDEKNNSQDAEIQDLKIKIGNYYIKVMSLDSYNALGTKESNTLYFCY